MKARGFALVEVIVVSMIIIVGVTGYVTLQSQFASSDTNLNLRTIAMQLAQEKLDNLRQFTVLETTSGQFAFNDIDDDAGGTIAAGVINKQIKSNNTFTHAFTRAWTVTDQYFVDLDADGTPDTWLNEGDTNLPSPLPPYPTQKAVTVSVSYSDVNGVARRVRIDGNLAPIPIGRSFQVTTQSANATIQPQVVYNPGRAPDVIAYELGNGESIETSKPVPEILRRGDTSIVQFETIRYIQNDNAADKLEQEEFLTVNCSCQLAGVGEGYTAAMTVLEGDSLVVKPGEKVSKMTGKPSTTGQPSYCDKCCRDHHDSDTTIANEQFYRTESGLPHKHYKLETNGLYSPAINVGDKYDEACRFKRVNGLFELYTDWQLLDIVQFESNYLFDDSKLTDYTTYGENVLAAEISGKPYPTPLTERDLKVAPGGFQMISRGIYLDNLKSAHKQIIIEKMQKGDDSWKAITPFYDINLTLLSNWSTGTPRVATITQEPIQTILDPANNFYGTYSRGRLEALADGVSSIKVMSYPSNTGITGTPPISPVEKLSTLDDAQVSVTVDSQANNEKFFGLIADINCVITIGNKVETCETRNDRKASYVNLSAMIIKPSPENFSCSISTPNGRTTPFFSCENVSENWSGTMMFTITKAGFNTTYKIVYPNGNVVTSNTLSLWQKLTATSNREYQLILEFTPQ